MLKSEMPQNLTALKEVQIHCPITGKTPTILLGDECRHVCTEALCRQHKGGKGRVFFSETPDGTPISITACLPRPR